MGNFLYVGCASSTLFKTLACDHTKVTPYFIESINSDRGFYAGPCRNLLTYVLGWCHPKDEEYVLMGEHCSPKYDFISNSCFVCKSTVKICFKMFLYLQSSWCILRNNKSRSSICSRLPKQCREIK